MMDIHAVIRKFGSTKAERWVLVLPERPRERTMNNLRCIVSGGLAGMMMDYLLGRASINAVVLERHADLFRDFRGETSLDPASGRARADQRFEAVASAPAADGWGGFGGAASVWRCPAPV
jgi:hypothetical protein